MLLLPCHNVSTCVRTLNIAVPPILTPKKKKWSPKVENVVKLYNNYLNMCLHALLSINQCLTISFSSSVDGQTGVN